MVSYAMCTAATLLGTVLPANRDVMPQCIRAPQNLFRAFLIPNTTLEVAIKVPLTQISLHPSKAIPPNCHSR